MPAETEIIEIQPAAGEPVDLIEIDDGAEPEIEIIEIQFGVDGLDSDMLKATYDPRNKAADAFDLSNHTGNITSASVLIDGGLL